MYQFTRECACICVKDRVISAHMCKGARTEHMPQNSLVFGRTTVLDKKATENFTYAHNDTSVPERVSRTSSINSAVFPEVVKDMRASAFERNIPVSSDETLAFLRICVAMAKPSKILEIGTAVGISGICMLEICPSAELVTIEKNADFAAEASANFEKAGISDRVTLLEGDAADRLRELDGQFDFIFLDGPKVQYIKYLPQIMRLLSSGGVIFADDVLLYGWVNGENPVPPKRRMLVEHIREYLDAVKNDPRLNTTIVDVGDGVALSVRK